MNPAGDEICESKRSLSEPSEKSAEKYVEKTIAIQSNSRISIEEDKIENFIDEVIEEEIKPVLARARNFLFSDHQDCHMEQRIILTEFSALSKR